jgi:pyridoxamine 5'-phosphate oxidase
VKLENSRLNYGDDGLHQATMQEDPVPQLAFWIEDAYERCVKEPNAMSLATVDAAGKPSSRIVLLRRLDQRGLVFYTSYTSKKGRDIDANPNVACAFYWEAMFRQVRVEGVATRLPEDESEAYFASRPRGHRLSAWASEQSEPIETRETLEERLQHFDQRFEGEDVPRPHSWGGYLIVPSRFEFWQGRTDRMHDRIAYVRDGRAWRKQRLQP